MCWSYHLPLTCELSPLLQDAQRANQNKNFVVNIISLFSFENIIKSHNVIHFSFHEAFKLMLRPCTQ